MWKKRPKKRPHLQVAPATEPRLSLTVNAMNQLKIEIDVPETGDLEGFARTLTMLQDGELMPYIFDAIRSAKRGGELLQMVDWEGRDDDEGVVCPTKVIHYNIKRNSF